MSRLPTPQFILLVSLITGLGIFILSNTSPSLSLVFLGSLTRPLPLAVWLAIAIGSGAFTTFICYFCIQLVVNDAVAKAVTNNGRTGRFSGRTNGQSQRYNAVPNYSAIDDDFLDDDDEYANDWVDEELSPQQKPWTPRPQPTPQGVQPPKSGPTAQKTIVTPTPQPARGTGAKTDASPAWDDPTWVESPPDWSDLTDDLEDWEDFEEATNPSERSQDTPQHDTPQQVPQGMKRVQEPETQEINSNVSKPPTPAKSRESQGDWEDEREPDKSARSQLAGSTPSPEPSDDRTTDEARSVDAPTQPIAQGRTYEVLREPTNTRKSGSSYSYTYRQSRQGTDKRGQSTNARDSAQNDVTQDDRRSKSSSKQFSAKQPSSKQPSSKQPSSRSSPKKPSAYTDNPQAGDPNAIYDANYRIITPPGNSGIPLDGTRTKRPDRSSERYPRDDTRTRSKEPQNQRSNRRPQEDDWDRLEDNEW